MNIEFSSEQIKAMAERAVTIIMTILLAKTVKWGWLSDSDSAALLPFMIILPSLAYAWWVNRNKELAKALANTVDAQGNRPIVVTSSAIAESTPQSNIVSNEAVTVVSKASGAAITPTPEGEAT